MTRWAMAALGVALIAWGVAGPGHRDVVGDVCALEGRRYAHLSQAASESCVELRRLAVACSGPGDDVNDYVPQRCGGNVVK